MSDQFSGGSGNAGAGAGTVTNVSGTANQIDVATGTTTPVISLDAAITLPGTLAVTGTHTISTADGVVGGGLALYPDNYAGADPCAKINAALLALPASGGVVDDSARTGNVTCGTNPWAGVTAQNTILKLGAANYQTTVSWVMPNRSQLMGTGFGGVGLVGTTITAVSGFPSSTAVIAMGSSVPIIATQISQLGVDCNNQTGSIGIQNLWSSNLSWVRDVDINNCKAIGLDVETDAASISGPYTNVYVADVTNGALAGTVAFKFNTVYAVSIINPQVSFQSGHAPTVCMDLDHFRGSVTNTDFDNCTNGIRLNQTNSRGMITLNHINGNSGITNTVLFGTGSNFNNFNSYKLLNIINTSSVGAVAVSDPIFGSNTLLNTVEEYSINDTAGGSGVFITCHATTPCNSSLQGNLNLGYVGGSGALGLLGSTSGTATFTAPAVAGTATNPITITNSLQLPSGTVYNWNGDTGLSRGAAGVVDVGTGAQGSAAGILATGGFAPHTTTQTTTYTALVSDSTVLCNGTFTTSLPTASVQTGQRYLIKNIGTGQCTVNVVGGVVLIDNATSLVISNQYEAKEFVYDGSQYWVF